MPSLIASDYAAAHVPLGLHVMMNSVQQLSASCIAAVDGFSNGLSWVDDCSNCLSWVHLVIYTKDEHILVRRAARALVSVSFSYGGYLNAGLMHKVSVVDNVPSMQKVTMQCAVSLNKGTSHTAAPVHVILDLPLPFIVLNTHRFRS